MSNTEGISFNSIRNTEGISFNSMSNTEGISNTEGLGNSEYPFIAIAPKSTLAWSGSTR